MKRLFAFALTVLMLMGCFTGCCCCDFGLGDRIEQIIDEEMNQLIGEDNTSPKNEGTEPPTSDQWRPGNELGLVEPGKLIVATNSDFPPYVYTNDNGGIAGIDIDIAKALAKKLDLQLVVLDTEFTDALEAVQNGKADVVITAVVATADRERVMDFSRPYATNNLVILISERSNIKTVEDLYYSRIGVQKNSTAYVYCSEDFGDDNVWMYDNCSDAIRALMSKEVDCFVLDQTLVAGFLNVNSQWSILDDYCTEEFSIGLPKGNSALKEAVDDALSELINDGTVQEIIYSYINSWTD